MKAKRDRAREIAQDTMQDGIEGALSSDLDRKFLVLSDRRWRKSLFFPQYDDRRLHHTTSKPVRAHVRKSRARG